MLVHFSTDCVYSGARVGYLEADLADAMDSYGRAKWLGEPLAGSALTIRTAIIGHELRGYRGVVEWFLAQSGRVPGFTGAIFSGLPTAEVARVLERYVFPHPELTGVVHVGVRRARAAGGAEDRPVPGFKSLLRVYGLASPRVAGAGRLDVPRRGSALS